MFRNHLAWRTAVVLAVVIIGYSSLPVSGAIPYDSPYRSHNAAGSLPLPPSNGGGFVMTGQAAPTDSVYANFASQQMFSDVPPPAHMPPPGNDGPESAVVQASHYIGAEVEPLESITETVEQPFVTDTAGNRISSYEFVNGSYPNCSDPWRWQILPQSLLYQAYLADVHQPRLATRWFSITGDEWTWDSALGGRVGLLRYGTDHPYNPEGWQLDVGGVAFVRMDLAEQYYLDVSGADFMAEVPLTYRSGDWEMKFGYYHLSSHMGDEYMIAHNAAGRRINYLRDSLEFGIAYRPTCPTSFLMMPMPSKSVRYYFEADYALKNTGGAGKWELRMGAEIAPMAPTGAMGAPFFAVAGHLLEEVDFGGYVSIQAGWAWRGLYGRMVRLGLHYYNGKSNFYQFYNEHEEQIGFGLWYDF